MTLYHANDRTTLGRRLSVVNHLKNGGFFVYRQFTAINYTGIWKATTRVYRTQYTHRVTDATPAYTAPSTAAPETVPGFFTATAAPKEQTVGYWDVWGSVARVSFNERRKSLDGGNLVSVRFSENGQVFLKQSFHSFDKFRGKAVTFALSGSIGTGSVKVLLRVDTGKTVLESRAFYSEYFGPYYRMVASFNVPLDITKLDAVIALEGADSSSAGISGASLCLGAYMGDLPFSENLPDIALPSGTIVAWMGESCPAGFRSIDENAYLLMTLGDPNAVRGNMAYGGTAQAGGTVDSMGPKGKTTLGDQSHTHAPVSTPLPSGPGATSFTGGAILDGGPGFGPDKGDAISEIDGRGHHDVKSRVDPGLSPYYFLADRGALPARTYSGDTPTAYAPSQHLNKVHFNGESAEPPRLKVRLCEKI